MAQLKSLNVLGNIAVTGNIVANGKLDINKLNIPTSSNATTLGPGANGQVLKSNGTSVYWGTDNNDVTNVSFTRHVTDGTKIGTITINNTSTDIYSGTHNKVNQSVSSYDGWRKIMLSGQYDTDKTFAVETTDDVLYASAALRCHPRTGGIDSAGTINAVTLSENGTALSKKYLQLTGGELSGGITIKNTSNTTGIGYSVYNNIPLLVNTSLATNAQKLSFMGPQGGTITFTMPSTSGTLALKSDIPTVSDTKVTQAYSTTNAYYPLLFSATSGTSSTSSRGATTTILCNKIYANPSTGSLETSSISTGNITCNSVSSESTITASGTIGSDEGNLYAGGYVRVYDDGDAYTGTDNFDGDDVDTNYYAKGIIVGGSYKLAFPAKSGTLATTSDIPKYLHTCEVTCTYSGNGTKATVFFSFYSTKSTAYNKLTFANDISVMGRVYPATGYIKANSLGLSIVQYIRFLAKAGNSTVYIKYLNENILGTFPTEIQSSFSDLKDTVTTIS